MEVINIKELGTWEERKMQRDEKKKQNVVKMTDETDRYRETGTDGRDEEKETTT